MDSEPHPVAEATPPASPASITASKKQPRHWWGQVRGQDGEVNGNAGRVSRSREGSPLHYKRSPVKSRSIADLVFNAVVQASGGGRSRAGRGHSVGEVGDNKHDMPPVTTHNSNGPASSLEAEEVPNITFTFFDAKEKAKESEQDKPKPNQVPEPEEPEEPEDPVTPDEEWLDDDAQRDKEVTETVVTPQRAERASVALMSDGDEDFVDARASSGSDSQSPSPPPTATPGRAEDGEKPEYVCIMNDCKDEGTTRPAEKYERPEYACIMNEQSHRQDEGTTPADSFEKPEYVSVDERLAGGAAGDGKPPPDGAQKLKNHDDDEDDERESTPSAVCNPIYRSPSYSNAVGEGLYASPRPTSRPAGAPPPPPVPEPDWTSTDSGSNQMTSEYATYYVLPNGQPTSLSGNEHQDYEELEYCQHRAPNGAAAAAAPTTATRSLGLLRVRSRLGRAWRVMRGWWEEERTRLGDTLMRHVHAQAVGAFNKDDDDDGKEAKGRRRRDVTRSCNTLDDDFEDDRNDDDEDDVDGKQAVRDEESAGMAKRAVSAPTLPRVLVLRRRKDSDAGSSASTTASTLGGFGTWGRPGRPRSALRRSKYMPEGQNGFEELRRYVKQGGDFCKDLTSILQERSEAEQAYAKSLAKLSSKLLKASKDAVGTVGQAWQRIGTEMECQGEIHRTFSVALSEEVVKPLKQLVDSQHRIRKSVESTVDKNAKSLSEWRQAEAKSKKTSFMCARDNEKLQDAMVEGRQSTRGSSLHLHHAVHSKMSDKDVAKLETKRRKAEESVKKADVEYYTFCIRAERARLEWETAVLRGSYCMQALEEERLQNLKELASMYLRHLREMGPKMVQSSDRLSEPVQNCDVAADIQTVVSLKGTGQPASEQLLPDFYAEHVTLGMNRDRRKQALLKILQLMKQDLERERRSKQGVENLARALQQTPNFGAEDSQQNVTEKLHHMRAMLTYLEAARYKVQSVLSELEGRPHQTHPLSSHIVVHRDRQGLQQSILKVPPWVRKDSLDQMNGESPDWMDRGAADGNSVQPDSDFDEFSSQGSEKDFNGSLIISECASTTQTSNNPSVGTCRALYQYAANLYDELNLNPGDVINIHDKQDDGWWLGELNGTVGIFPATYVEEIK